MKKEEHTCTRWINPAVTNEEIWPGANGYPWKDSGMNLWTREALLRRLGNGDLIATWTTGGFTEPADGNFTMITASSDDGATWQDRGRFQHPSRGLFTTELFMPNPNEIHAFLQTYAFGEWMVNLQSYRSISYDNGNSWTIPHSIPGGIHNIWVNRGIVHSSGRWIIPVSWAEHNGNEWAKPSYGSSPAICMVGKNEAAHCELPFGADCNMIYAEGGKWAHSNHRYCCGVMISDDGGKSFALRGCLSSGDKGHLLEPRVVELSNGGVVMLMRSFEGGALWRSFSSDAGESWQPGEKSDIPNPSAKINILRASDGRIFLLHNPSSGSGMSARNPLSLWISNDDMKSWETQIDIIRDTDCPLNYPDGYIDEERNLLDFVWENGISVYRTRLPLNIKS